MGKFIHRGDEYAIPMTLLMDDVIITDNMIQGLRIKIGQYENDFPDGTVTYHDDKWWVPFTQEQTLSMAHGAAPYQVQIKINGDIISSDVGKLDVKNSIILNEWGD